MATTKNFGDVIRAKLAADPALAEAVENEQFNCEISMEVYEARIAAKLTQKRLAELVGTQQSVISRIEDADYDGHSLSLLRRIAKAMGKKIRVEFDDCPETVEPQIEVTFPLNWRKRAQWPIKIETASSVGAV